MRFSTGVFIVDGVLAGTLAVVGPIFFTALAFFLIGAIVSYLWRERVAADAESLYSRFKRLDSEGREKIETAFRDAERRLFGKR